MEAMTTPLDAIEINPAQQPATHSVIWLHGLGANGHDFESIPSQLAEVQRNHPLRFVFPHAPEMPVTINSGMRMPAWFDVQSLDWDADWDEAGMHQSCEQIRQLIAKENGLGIKTENIFLAGFSQGGAVALLAGLTHAEKLAGLIGLSTFLPLPEDFSASVNHHVPIFLAHGQQDHIVDFNYGEKTHAQLQQINPNITWRAYPDLMHSVNQAEIADLDTWLNQQLTSA